MVSLLMCAGVLDVLLRLETVLVSGEGHGVDESISSDVFVAAGHFDSLVVLADLLERTLLLARCSVARFKTVQKT